MGFFRIAGRIILDIIVVLAAVAILPDVFTDQTYDTFVFEPKLPLTGALAPNTLLDRATRLFDGHLNGPESVASRDPEEVFVGMHGGAIIKIWGPKFDHIKTITRLGPGCNAVWEERKCGRPLGLRFSRDGTLLAADSYLGIFRINVDTGEKTQLVNSKDEIEGHAPLLIDDLDEDDDGNIFYSDASYLAYLDEAVLEGLMGPSGRLIKYDVKTKVSTVLMDKLYFANGVQLSPDKDFILVSETFRYRVLRYWLRGPKAGTHDVFAAGLPGAPDNIRPRPQGGYYVSLVSNRRGEVDMIEVLGGHPWVRRFIARMALAPKRLLEKITELYENQYTARVTYWMMNMFTYCGPLTGNYSMVLELDERGAIVNSLQGTSGTLKFISETVQVGDKLFFGSPYNKYLGMVHLNRIGQTPSGRQVIVEEITLVPDDKVKKEEIKKTDQEKQEKKTVPKKQEKKTVPKKQERNSMNEL